VVGTFNQTNRLADGYQVEVDPQIMRATEGVSRPAEAASGKSKAAKSKQPKSKPKRARKAA
jgi:hypothetical protein